MSVSVVIPLFNKARYIRRAVESVLAQTMREFEVVVVDDGSTDGGGELVRGIRDPRLRVVAQPNAGVSEARNRGVREASNDRVAFLDADDEWMPEFLATVMALHARHPEAGMVATAYLLGGEGVPRRPAFRNCPAGPQGGLLEDYFLSALGPPPVSSSSVMVARRAMEEAGGFPRGIPRGEDLHTWIRIAFRHPVAWSPCAGAIYHVEAGNRACSQVPPSPDVSIAPAIESVAPGSVRAASLLRSALEYLDHTRIEHAKACLLLGRRDCARSLVRKARGSRRFRWERRGLILLAWLPRPAIRLAMAARRVLRRPDCDAARTGVGAGAV